MLRLLEQNLVEAIARALGDTHEGLTNREIDTYLEWCGIVNHHEISTKWERLFYSLWNQQVRDNSAYKIEKFILQSMAPSRYLKNPDKFTTRKENLNKALAFAGYYVNDNGEICEAKSKAKTIADAEQRATSLCNDLLRRKTHEKVLYYCKAELLQENYFHAVQEAVKGVFDRLKELSGQNIDGNKLVTATLLRGNQHSPCLIINNYQTESEQSEQHGFASLLNGIYGMFRNPTAHEVRVKWNMAQEDAEDLLSMISLIHRRLDKAQRIR